MGVDRTGAIYKGFTFNGINSKDYGVYITGEAVYNAPERDVEVIDIAGRNGAYIRDNGRFNNILVTYTAGMFGDAQTDFAEGISDLRNALCAAIGYQRLEDEYNTGEYREAVYKSGLEVSPELMGRAGTFNITFECKPQRFLTSGETAQAVADGGTLTNPTLFPAKPLLEVEGYGIIEIEDQVIKIISAPIGWTPVLQGWTDNAGAGLSASIVKALNLTNLNSGDEVQIRDGYIAVDLGTPIQDITNFTHTGNLVKGVEGRYTNTVKFAFPSNGWPFYKGTAKTASASVEAGIMVGGSLVYVTVSLSLSVNTAGRLTFTVSVPNNGADGFGLYLPAVYGNSTKSALGNPIYIDLDIGEAYKEENGEIISVNNAVSLPAELPVLWPGINDVNYDPTVTALRVKPRWWKV